MNSYTGFNKYISKLLGCIDSIHSNNLLYGFIQARGRFNPNPRYIELLYIQMKLVVRLMK